MDMPTQHPEQLIFHLSGKAPGAGLEWDFDAASGVLSVVASVNTAPAADAGWWVRVRVISAS